MGLSTDQTLMKEMGRLCKYLGEKMDLKDETRRA